MLGAHCFAHGRRNATLSFRGGGEVKKFNDNPALHFLLGLGPKFTKSRRCKSAMRNISSAEPKARLQGYGYNLLNSHSSRCFFCLEVLVGQCLRKLWKSCFNNRALVKAIFEAPKCL